MCRCILHSLKKHENRERERERERNIEQQCMVYMIFFCEFPKRQANGVELDIWIIVQLMR
jgi:hypothetical protein